MSVQCLPLPLIVSLIRLIQTKKQSKHYYFYIGLDGPNSHHQMKEGEELGFAYPSEFALGHAKSVNVDDEVDACV
jgi:hypothetical protein